MRILYAFPEPLPLEKARGLQAVNTVAALARCGLNVELLHSGSTNAPFARYGMPKPEGVTVRTLSRRAPFPFSWIRSNGFFARRLASAIEVDSRDTLVFVRHLKLAAWICKNKPSWRLVYEAHEVFSETAPPARRSARAEEERLVVAHASAIVANTNATAVRLVSLYGTPARIEVVPNGADLPVSLPTKDWSQAGQSVVYAGSMYPWKGVDDLAKAASMLPGMRITIIGGSSEQNSRLSGLAGGHGAVLRLPGRVSHENVLRQLSESCIAVLPNRLDPDSEFSSPVKLFEYMGCGCAVVATRVPAFREVLQEDDVVWAQPGDPQDLARAIRVLAGDPERARSMGEALRLRSQHYTWDARARRLASLFGELIRMHR